MDRYVRFTQNNENNEIFILLYEKQSESSLQILGEHVEWEWTGGENEFKQRGQSEWKCRQFHHIQHLIFCANTLIIQIELKIDLNDLQRSMALETASPTEVLPIKKNAVN